MGLLMEQILIALTEASSLFLVASGLTIVFGVTRVVNFAHGSLFMLGAYAAWHLGHVFPATTLGFWAAVLCATLIVAALGALLEIGVLRAIYRAPELFQLVATFGLVLVIEEAVKAGYGPEEKPLGTAHGLAGAFRLSGHSIPTYDLVMIAAGPLVLGAVWLLFHRTRWGVLVRAATEDREMLAALGVNQRWLFTSVFVLGASLAGLGGALQVPKGGANLDMDLGIIAEAFVVTVIGGMGNVLGAFLAAGIIATLKALGVFLGVSEINIVTPFLVMALVLVLRPHGLLGRRSAVDTPHQGVQAPLRLPRGLAAGLPWLAALALLLVPLVGDAYTPTVLSTIAIAMLFAASLHFLMGVGGLVSFGHAAYFGAGAYVAALTWLGRIRDMAQDASQATLELAASLAQSEALFPALAGTLLWAVGWLLEPLIHVMLMDLGWLLGWERSVLLVILQGSLFAGVLALLVGWLCVRLSGVYLAMLTLAAAQILWSIVWQARAVTGGDDGMFGIWAPEPVAEPLGFWGLAFVLCVGGVWALRRITFAPFGYTFRACRDAPLRADAIGISVKRHQGLAFALVGLFAGGAGSVYTFQSGVVDPEVLAIPESVDALIMVLWGGVQTLSGAVVGAVAFTGIEQWLVSAGGKTIDVWLFEVRLPSWIGDLWRAILGLIILIIAILVPQGLVGGARRILPPSVTGMRREDLG